MTPALQAENVIRMMVVSFATPGARTRAAKRLFTKRMFCRPEAAFLMKSVMAHQRVEKLFSEFMEG